MTGISASILALSLAAPTVPRQDPCQDETVEHHAGPASTVETVDCASLKLTFGYEIEAGGTLKLVDLGVEGSLVAEYESKSQCRSEVIEYDGDVWRCGVPETGSYCIEKVYEVPYRIFREREPCPTTSLLEVVRHFLSNGGALPDCKPLQPVPGDFVRKSSAAYSCDDGRTSVSDDPFVVEGNVFEGGDAVFEVVHGTRMDRLPTGPGLDPGLAHLLTHLATGDGSGQPALVKGILAHCGELTEARGLGIDYSVASRRAGTSSTVRSVVTGTGTFRSDGDFHVLLPQAGFDEERRPVAWAEDWSSLDGHLLLGIVGNPHGLIFPDSNGIARRKQAYRVPFAERTRRWLENPFRFSPSSSAWYDVVDEGDGVLRIDQTFLGDAALAGGRRATWVRAEKPTEPFRASLFDALHNEVEITHYRSWRDLGHGVFRPLEIEEVELDARGNDLYQRLTRYAPPRGVSQAAADTLGPVDLPRPTESIWFVQIR